MDKGYLILSDKTYYPGYIFGHGDLVFGEVVFNTSMTGYQEILTDPSYKGQIVIQTYPLIGNYGINDEINESDEIQVSGYVVRKNAEFPSHISSKKTVDQFLKQYEIMGISEIDTRAVVRNIRSKGVMNGLIVRDNDPSKGIKYLESIPNYDSLDLAKGINNRKDLNIKYGENLTIDQKYKIAVIDCGVKENILKLLYARKCQIKVFAPDFSINDLESFSPDGILISPGPGDPIHMEFLVEKIKLILNDYPIFGICLGHQIIARAFDSNTYKLKFGHRGGNQPVMDIKQDKVYITAQNHGYAVSSEIVNPDIEITHINLNDNTVSGIKHKKLPIMGIQYHSEASPGPKDNEYLFDEFIKMISINRNNI
tara:strand:- start:1271 stop:2374 length:1104 start_codon:yes stop_codon:yes gene_type:complete